MIANLPYGVAATIILRTVAELPTIERWVVMVQREVGERFAAAPGSGAYGVPSVLAQLACEVRVLRAVPRTVFRPVPNVDSVLLGLTRRGPGVDPRLSALVHAAFAHRRKTLPGSLALAGPLPLAGGGTRPGPSCASAPAPRSRRSASVPTRAPSGLRPRSSARSRSACEHPRPCSRPPRSTSACCSAGPATTAATSSSPCLSR